MTRFSTTIEITAPAERVWKVMSDIDRWHEWTASVTSIKRLGGKPFAVGTRALVRQPKFPPALWKITKIVPGRSFTWISVAPGMRVEGHHEVEPSAGGSRAHLTLEYFGVLGDLFARMTKNITERYVDFEAQGLKTRSESTPAP